MSLYACIHICTPLCVQEDVCTHLFAPQCVQDGAQCVKQCVLKTKKKPLTFPKLRGNRGIMLEKEPEYRKSLKRAMDR